MLYLDKIFEVVDGNEKNTEPYLDIRTQILQEKGLDKVAIEERIGIVRTVMVNPYYHFFLAYMQGQLVGYLRLLVGESPINRHVAKLKMAMLSQHSRAEFKKRLLQKALTFGIEKDIKRMEMIVGQDRFEDVNQLVLMGFQIEGKLRRVNYESEGQRYLDSYLMAKML